MPPFERDPRARRDLRGVCIHRRKRHEAARAEDEFAAARDAASDEAGVPALGHDGHAGARAKRQHARHTGGIAREAGHARHSRETARPIRFERAELVPVANDADPGNLLQGGAEPVRASVRGHGLMLAVRRRRDKRESVGVAAGTVAVTVATEVVGVAVPAVIVATITAIAAVFPRRGAVADAGLGPPEDGEAADHLPGLRVAGGAGDDLEHVVHRHALFGAHAAAGTLVFVESHQ